MAFIPPATSILNNSANRIFSNQTKRRHKPFYILSSPTQHRAIIQATSTTTVTPASANAAILFLQSLGLSNEDARKAVTRHPRLSTQENLPAVTSPLLAYLADELHLSPRQITRTIRHAPQILFRESKQFQSRLQFLEAVARIPLSSLPSAISKCPHILWMNLNDAADVVDTVLSACPLLTPVTLGNIFSRVPQALVTNPKMIKDHLDHIRSIGVKDDIAIGRVVARMPLVLVLHPDRSIAKRTNYLRNQIQLPLETIGKVVAATPELLQWNVEKKMKPRIELIASLVGDDILSQVIEKVPTLVGTNDMLDRVLWLRDYVGLNEDEIRIILREAPAILTYSIEGNLAPKWTFIRETMKGSKQDLVQAPKECLCANLQQRAMPRYAFLISNGITNVPVLDILRGSDAAFCRDIAKCEPDLFRSYVDNDTYLLFFSSLV